MTSGEFAVIREQLGMSDDDLASKLGVSARLVQKWGDGRMEIADRFAFALQSLAYAKRREDLLASVKITACPIADGVVARSRGGDKLSTTELLNFNRHVRLCPVCQARESYVTSKLGSVPRRAPPKSVAGRVYLWVAEQIGRLPEWARPAAGGATILFAVTAGRLLFAIPAIVLSGRTLREFAPILAVPFVAAFGGAAGGFGYTFLGKPLRSVPVAGRYLAGVVTVACYMIILGVIFAVAGSPMVTSESDGVIFAAVTIGFGLFVGHSWFKPDVPGGALEITGVAG